MKTLKIGDSGFKKILHTTGKITALVSLLILYSCSGAEKYKEEYADNAKLADSVSSIISSSAAKIGKADSNHTFIRTADIKFKVHDVKNATFSIEDVVSKHNGFVTYTNLSSKINYVNRTKVTEDSTKEATHFQVDNSITIRVPNTHLDAALREIAPLMQFLDHRTIKAEDIKLILTANQLAENRYKTHKERFTEAIDEKGKKLRETSEAENSLLMKQEHADNTRIETMDLLDQAAYSTVTLYIYQDETIKYTMLPNEDIIVPYKPSFLLNLGNAVKDGWVIFENIILFFVQIWGILVLIIGLFFAIKWLIVYLSKMQFEKHNLRIMSI